MQKETFTYGRKNTITSVTYDGDIGLVRYLPNGSLDPSFGAGGKVSTSISNYEPGGLWNRYDFAAATALQPDGKIVVVGYSKLDADGNASVVLRYNTDGSPDPSFGQGGEVVGRRISTLSERLTDVVIQGDGKIVAAGVLRNLDGSNSAFVERYDTDGNLDPTFGSGGMLIFDASQLTSSPTIALQADGGIVVASGRNNGVDIDFALARLTDSGVLDTTFGGTGIVVVDRGGTNESTNDVVVQSDGKIVVAGSLRPQPSGPSDSFVARFTPEGSLDMTFGVGGLAVQSFSANSGAFSESNPDGLSALAIQPDDGKIVAVGVAESNSANFLIARFQGDPVSTGAALSGQVSTATSTTVDSYALASSSLTASNDEDVTLFAFDPIRSRSKKT